MSRAFVVLFSLTVLAAPAHADDLTGMLEKGPMAGIDVDNAGRFASVFSVTDIDAPIAQVWTVLVDYPSYRFFMPRVADVEASPGPAGATIVRWTIDTPVVTTEHTNSNTADIDKMLVRARTIDGDMVGSRYEWRLVSLGAGKTRMFHTAWPRNMNSVVDALDDVHQTITISVALSSAMATIRALKGRAELLEHNAHPKG